MHSRKLKIQNQIKMKLDIDKTIEEMLSAIKGEAGRGWLKVKEAATEFAHRRRSRYVLVAQEMIKGNISQDKFKSILDDEKRLLESELLVLAVISKATAQRAANSAINVFEKAVMVAIGL